MTRGLTIRWLGWAGVELEAEGQTLAIDLLGSPDGVLAGTGIEAPMPTVVPARAAGEVAAGLCTHLHRDHTDAAALAATLRPGAPVLVPAGFGGDEHENLWTLAADGELTSCGLPRDEVAPWEVRQIGPFRIAAVPAVDTLGDPQVSWAIEAAGARVIHLGDTMLHGYWWRAAHRYGPFDAVLTPINGPIVCFPHCQPPSPFPASLDARHAAVAARCLGAGVVVPIHYDGFHNEHYVTEPDELGRFTEAVADEPYSLAALRQGEELQL